MSATRYSWNGENYEIYIFRGERDSLYSEIFKNEVPLNYSCQIFDDVRHSLRLQHCTNARSELIEDAKLRIQEEAPLFGEMPS